MPRLQRFMGGITCALTLALAACASPAPAPGPGAEAEARTLLDRWVVSWNSYDLREVDSLFVTDSSVSYFSSERDGLINGITALRTHHEGFGFVTGGKTSPNRLWLEEVVTREHEGATLVVATWLFERAGSTPPVVQRGPVTFVVVRTPAGARIQHAHFSNAPPAT